MSLTDQVKKISKHPDRAGILIYRLTEEDYSCSKITRTITVREYLECGRSKFTYYVAVDERIASSNPFHVTRFEAVFRSCSGAKNAANLAMISGNIQDSEDAILTLHV